MEFILKALAAKDPLQAKRDLAEHWARLLADPSQLTPEEIALAASNLAPGGIALTAVGGPKARTAPLAKMKKAGEMHSKGASMDEIKAETGTWLGPDGVPRFPISTQYARLRAPAESIVDDAIRGGGKIVPQEAILYHPEMFAAYPGSRTVQVRFAPEMAMGDAYYSNIALMRQMPESSIVNPNKDVIAIGLSGEQLTDKDLLKLLMHENTHGMQGAEGMAQGANPNLYSAIQRRAEDAILDRKFPDAARSGTFSMRHTDPYELYKNTYGEREARASEQVLAGLAKDTYDALKIVPRGNFSPIIKGAKTPAEFERALIEYSLKTQGMNKDPAYQKALVDQVLKALGDWE